jgi:hypothetical protein
MTELRALWAKSYLGQAVLVLVVVVLVLENPARDQGPAGAFANRILGQVVNAGRRPHLEDEDEVNRLL